MTSNSAAAVSSRRKPAPAARRTLSSARAARPLPTARRNNGWLRRKNPPPFWARRLNSSNWTVTRIWKSAPLTPSNWRASSAALRPAIVLAPSLVENQHPDHPRLGQLVRDACRLARYGGVKELRRSRRAHAIEQLFYYAVTPEAEPSDITPVLIDVSAPDVLKTWTAAMERMFRKFPNAVTWNCSSRARGCAGCAPASAMPLPCFQMTRWCSTRWRPQAEARGDFNFNHGWTQMNTDEILPVLKHARPSAPESGDPKAAEGCRSPKPCGIPRRFKSVPSACIRG